MQPTKTQLTAGLKILIAVSETIREVGGVPSGTLYSMLMGKMDLSTYESMLRTLKGSGLVTETAGHMLKWAGPAMEVSK